MKNDSRKNIAIITARGGSKRIPRKNIKEFAGKPMIYYAIKAAQGTGLFEEIMVSTEDQEIASISQSLGASVPFMRSAKNADDFAGTMDVLKEVVGEYKSRGRIFDSLCCIYPCVPLITPESITEAYKKLYSNPEISSITPAVRFSFPIQRAFRVNEKGILEYREPKCAPMRSQDLEPMYHDAGMFYWYKGEFFNRLETAPEMNKTGLYEMDEQYVQDIDNMSDWKLAEMKYQILFGSRSV